MFCLVVATQPKSGVISMAKPTLPVTLHLGDITAAEVGTIDIPFITGPASEDATGQWHVEVKVDHAVLRQSLADLLRRVADEFEKGPTDG
jgi:hypothetical protein